jgi:hypothetical protein
MGLLAKYPKLLWLQRRNLICSIASWEWALTPLQICFLMLMLQHFHCRMSLVLWASKFTHWILWHWAVGVQYSRIVEVLSLEGKIAVVFILIFKYLSNDYSFTICESTLWFFWAEWKYLVFCSVALFWFLHLLIRGLKGMQKMSYQLFAFYKTHGQHCPPEVL